MDQGAGQFERTGQGFPARAMPAVNAGKMRPPRQRIAAALRPRLLDALDTAASASLTIAQSPAGFGKTTLLGQWYEALKARPDTVVAWLSLDEDDGEVTRFLANLALTLGAAGIALPNEVKTQAPSLSEAAFRRVAIGEAIEAAAEDVVLILDDYHRVQSPDVDAAIDYLARTASAGLNIVLSTRDQPALRIADLEAQGLVARIGPADLALTLDDCGLVFGDLLDRDELAALHARTEGWAVALQLAKLWLEREPSRRADIRTFGGQTDTIARYLLEQVFEDLDEPSRDFLTDTSILDSFDADLADIVRGQADSRRQLAALARFDALIVPIDGDRRWVRYHHLFAEFLQERLAERGADRAAALRSRASAYFAANGDLLQAVRHAVRGGDRARAVALVDESGGWEIVLQRGIGFARGLLAVFEPAMVEGEPVLLRMQGYLQMKFGDLAEARRCTGRAVALSPDGRGTRDDLIVGALLRTYSDDVHAPHWMPELADRIDTLAPDDHLGRGTLRATLAVGMLGAARFDHAERESRLGVEAMVEARSVLGEAYCRYHLAQSLFYRGFLGAAEVELRAALVMAEENYGGDRALKAIGNSLLAHLLYWRGEYGEAQRRIDTALEAVEAHDSWLDILAVAYFTATALARRARDAASVDALLDRAASASRERGLPQLAILADAWHVETLLERGNLAAAEARAAHADLAARLDDPGQGVDWRCRTAIGLALAQLQCRSDRSSEALRMLRSLREKSSDQARALDVARIDAALAVVLRARGETDAMTQAAMRALAYAMDADAPSVVTGLATDFDPVLAAVLRKPDLDDEPLRSFARRLRSAAPARRAATDEALSPRELAVLGELCVGRANKEIGRQLDLTENTVKFHLKRIYEKLGAHTRSGAVTAAIQRGLIRID